MHFPSVYLELINSCPCSCTFCPDSIQTRKRQAIDINIATKIIDDLLTNHTVDRLYFHIMGDPLSYPKIFELLEFVDEAQNRLDVIRKANVRIVTSGLPLLRSSKLRNRIHKLPVDWLSFSIRGTNESEFALKRTKFASSYVNYINTIVEVIHNSLDQTQRQSFSLNYFHSINSDWNIVRKEKFVSDINQVSDIIKYWEDILGVEAKYNDIDRAMFETNHASVRFSLSDRVIIRFDRVNLWNYSLVGNGKYEIVPEISAFCEHHNNLAITNAGLVVTCCEDYDSQNVFGDLKVQTIADVYDTPEFRAKREANDQNKQILTMCQQCKGSLA